MEKWRTLIWLGIIILIAVEVIREMHMFRVTHYKIQSPKLKNVKERKVLLLSDLHNCEYGKGNEKLLNAIKAEKPDMILVAGDILVGKAGVSTEVARNLITQLPKLCDTYYASGNHEQRLKEYPEEYGTMYEDYKACLEKSGVHYLENEKVETIWDDCSVAIYGLEVPEETYKKFRKVKLPARCVETCLGKGNPSKYQILIAHNPIYMPEYVKWGADLIVSGHVHGGVARIPHWRGVLTPQMEWFPKYSGELTKEGDTSIVVSKGLGTHTINIRFWNPAELVVLHIGGSEE